MRTLLACLLCVILVTLSKAYGNNSGLLESKMNKKRRMENSDEGPSSVATTAISEDETTFKYSLLSIQIEGEHICTGTPIARSYGFTTANCALKVRMNLPDLEGNKVRVHYSDTLEYYGPWVAVRDVKIRREEEMFTLDESYKKRLYDYGIIQFRELCPENYITPITSNHMSHVIPEECEEVNYIVWTPSEPCEDEENIVYTGPPKIIKGVVLEKDEAEKSYQGLNRLPFDSILVSKESLSKGNIGTPVIVFEILVGIIAHVDEGGSAAVMVHLGPDVPLNPLKTHVWG